MNDLMSGYTIFSSIIQKEKADHNFWKGYIKQNFPKGVVLLINISNNFDCVVCGNLSRHYTSKRSLASHLQFVHYHQTVDYILKNIITKDPEILEGLMNRGELKIWNENLK